jgi:hypothetical protein
VGVKRFTATMGSVVHDLLMLTTANDKQPPGTVSTVNCGYGSGTSDIPRLAFVAYRPSPQLDFPADDGAGKPLALEVAAHTAGFLKIHFRNDGTEPVTTTVAIDTAVHDANVAYTKTATYMTYNASLSIPAGATGVVQQQSCNVDPNLRFWRLSTHTHKQAVKTEVKDGSSVAFTATNWENPGAATFVPTSLHTFSSGKITFACTYDNPTTIKITSGDSNATDEQCVAIGYFFPAAHALSCYDGFGPF